jgi:pyruvate dehydrogenase (quinone)
VDLTNLFKDVLRIYKYGTAPSQIGHLIDRAMRIAKAERTVTCCFPNDVQDLDYEEPSHMHSTIHTGLGYSEPRLSFEMI